MLIKGGCHCRNVTFTLTWEPDPAAIPARACSCSFCTKHGGVWTSTPDGSLAIVIADPSRLSIYAFGTGTADFHVCATCGAVPVVTSRIDGRLYAVVSVNAFENVDPALLVHARTSFDGESETTRLARRKRGWIGRVEYVGPGAAGRRADDAPAAR